MRGYAAIGLDRPKDKANLGGVLRAAGCYGAAMVAVSGDRMGKYATDTMQAYKQIPCINVDDLLATTPLGCTPVVIEIHPRAKPLYQFCHPPNAFYIFGPEDGSVLAKIVERVHNIIYIPTTGCMNLAATVNVVLYDRQCKGERT